jgi:hypothetical protein
MDCLDLSEGLSRSSTPSDNVHGTRERRRRAWARRRRCFVEAGVTVASSCPERMESARWALEPAHGRRVSRCWLDGRSGVRRRARRDGHNCSATVASRVTPAHETGLPTEVLRCRCERGPRIHGWRHRSRASFLVVRRSSESGWTARVRAGCRNTGRGSAACAYRVRPHRALLGQESHSKRTKASSTSRSSPTINALTTRTNSCRS